MRDAETKREINEVFLNILEGRGHVAVASPRSTERDEFIRDISVKRADSLLVVSSVDSYEEIRQRYGDCYIIDCTQRGDSGPIQNGYVIGDSADLTKIGIEIGSWLDDTEGETVVVFDGLSVLAMYRQEDVIFQFVHTLQGRLNVADASGIFVVDGDFRESQVPALENLFSRRLKVRMNAKGEPEGMLESRTRNVGWKPLYVN